MNPNIKPLEHEAASERVKYAYETYFSYLQECMCETELKHFYKSEGYLAPLRSLERDLECIDGEVTEQTLYEAYEDACVDLFVGEIDRYPKDVRSEAFDYIIPVKYPFMKHLKERVLDLAAQRDVIWSRANQSSDEKKPRYIDDDFVKFVRDVHRHNKSEKIVKGLAIGSIVTSITAIIIAIIRK